MRLLRGGRMKITQTAYEAFCRVRGLIELSAQNNMSTQRTQNVVLVERFPGDDRLIVALTAPEANNATA